MFSYVMIVKEQQITKHTNVLGDMLPNKVKDDTSSKSLLGII